MIVGFLYLLATLWAVGCAGLCYFAVTDKFMFDTWKGRTVAGMLLFVMWCLLCIPPFAFIEHESGPELATLLKSEWKCGGGHNSTTTTYVSAGKVLVPSTTTTFVCDVYVRGGTE